MAGLCEGGNEPSGSLKASKCIGILGCIYSSYVKLRVGAINETRRENKEQGELKENKEKRRRTRKTRGQRDDKDNKGRKVEARRTKGRKGRDRRQEEQREDKVNKGKTRRTRGKQGGGEEDKDEEKKGGKKNKWETRRKRGETGDEKNKGKTRRGEEGGKEEQMGDKEEKGRDRRREEQREDKVNKRKTRRTRGRQGEEGEDKEKKGKIKTRRWEKRRTNGIQGGKGEENKKVETPPRGPLKRKVELDLPPHEVWSVIKFLNAQGIAPIEIDRQLSAGPNVMSKQMSPPREVRSVIKFLNAQGIAPIEIDRQLSAGPNVMSKQMLIYPCIVGPYHHGMARPQVADRRDGLQIWRVAANILNKQSWTADKGLGEGLTTHHRKKQLVTNPYNKRWNGTDSLARPQQRNKVMRFEELMDYSAILSHRQAYLWGRIKNMVYQVRPTTREDMKQRIREACGSLSCADLQSRVVGDDQNIV
ncbi:hypothetical protein ANN_22341 [Periplaneta americana]|uniref:Uncharacterized protein n=1 Tax=Periplaneta americana TaxID=6978 RepID=A0ABQ8S8P2_PERAM|nr:hypothetical protein ANN_22341 [Periplaneta americana]